MDTEISPGKAAELIHHFQQRSLTNAHSQDGNSLQIEKDLIDLSDANEGLSSKKGTGESGQPPEAGWNVSADISNTIGKNPSIDSVNSKMGQTPASEQSPTSVELATKTQGMSSCHKNENKKSPETGRKNVPPDYVMTDDEDPKAEQTPVQTSSRQGRQNSMSSSFQSEPEPKQRFAKQLSRQYSASSCDQFLEFSKRNNSKNLDETKIEPMFTIITSDLEDKLTRFFRNSVAIFSTKRIPRKLNQIPKNDYWNWGDPDFVRLPFSPHNRPSGSDGGKGKWEVICRELSNLSDFCCKSPAAKESNLDLAAVLQKVVAEYRSDSEDKSNFKLLNNKNLKPLVIAAIPVIVDWTLRLPALVGSPVPFLKSGETKTIYVTKQLTASMLANAFFCTFPEQKTYLNLPDINFFRLFHESDDNRSKVKQEKLKCILNYFELMTNAKNERAKNHVISYERRCIRSKREWDISDKKLIEVKVEGKNRIEDAQGMLQVDFANRFVGGGVLNEGAVMEEIRFSISPELILARLFTASLDDDEVLVVTGSQIFSTYTGYASTFQYCGPADVARSPKVDNFGRQYTQIVAMDALYFPEYEVEKQFHQRHIDRELHKCYVAFIHSSRSNTSVATGNWGCGAFNGNPELKFLIQFIAASEAERLALVYHSVSDEQAKSIMEFTRIMENRKVKVRDLYNAVVKYHWDAAADDGIFKYLRDNLKKKSYFKS